MNRLGQAGLWTIRNGAIAALVFLSACSTNSLLHPYPAQVQPLLRDMETGRTVSVDNAFGRRVLGRDRILYLMEQGRLAQLQGDFAASEAAYTDALAAIRERDERAVVSASDLTAKTASLVINDNVIPYAGDGYERVMLHTEQAMNYLFTGDLEGAGVEVRLAAAQQAEALKRRAREVEDARERAQREGLSKVQPGNLSAVYARLDSAAGRVKNSFQNAYTFYVSAVVREMLGDDGGAFIDYKKAAEIAPENPYVQADVLRLAEKLGMADDLVRYRAMWPGAVGAPVPAGQGDLVVFFEDGFLPPKREFSIYIPLTGSGGWTPIALPVYDNRREPERPLLVRVEGGPEGQTAPVCSVSALAARALRERMPAIATRQILRAVAKGAATRLAYTRSREPNIAVFLMTLYNIVTERADLRGWSSLPQRAEVMRLWCSPGRHLVTLTHSGTGAAVVIEVDIRPGGRTVVLASRVGGQLTARVIAFGADGRP